MNRQELIMNYAGDLISLTAFALIIGMLIGCLATYLYYRQKEHIREKLDYEKQIMADSAKILRIHNLLLNTEGFSIERNSVKEAAYVAKKGSDGSTTDNPGTGGTEGGELEG